jgi:hypothetical protein
MLFSEQKVAAFQFGFANVLSWYCQVELAYKQVGIIRLLFKKFVKLFLATPNHEINRVQKIHK